VSTDFPLISVILPFHGRSLWLDEAIQSISTQTFTDWELLLIDNGAENTAKRIATDFATNDSRIRIIEENKTGISHALNTGLSHARADIIARMDDDDISHPDRLQLQWEKLNSEERNMVVTCRVDAVKGFEPDSGMQEYMDWQNGLLNPQDHYLNRFIDAPLVHPTLFCRKEVFERYGTYSTGGIPEDYELWLRWMESGVRFIKTEQALLGWREHADRLTRNHSDYSGARFAEVRMDYLTRWLKENLGSRKLIFCGTSRKSRQRAKHLLSAGIKITAFTDVKQHYRDLPFIGIEEIKKDDDLFYLSLLPRRASNSLREFLYKRGLTEGGDFLLAG
jgi:glycosyltransferase involved in cell wall biosynthesis